MDVVDISGVCDAHVGENDNVRAIALMHELIMRAEANGKIVEHGLLHDGGVEVRQPDVGVAALLLHPVYDGVGVAHGGAAGTRVVVETILNEEGAGQQRVLTVQLCVGGAGNRILEGA